MPRRPFDASRARCDTCGQLYKEGDDMYTVMSEYDPLVKDKDVLVSFRHYKCHQNRLEGLQKALDRFGDASKAATEALAKLRKLGL